MRLDRQSESSITVKDFQSLMRFGILPKSLRYLNRLPKQHLAIIQEMTAAPGTIFTRKELLDIGWSDYRNERLEANVVVAISNIRLQFGNDCIITVRGLGYMSNIRSHLP